MKLKYITQLLTLSIVLSLGATSVYAAKFSDMKGYTWAEKYVEDTANKGIITGYPDGGFKPGNPVSRIESLIMIANLYPKAEIDNTYKNNSAKYKAKLDTAKIENWARPYVVFALEKGIIPNTDKMINSLVDPTTRKSIAAKRYEVAVFLVRGLGIENEMNSNAKLSYKDNKDIISQAIPFIELLQRKGIISKLGDGNGYFYPTKTINRAETAVMISNAYKYSAKAKAQSSSKAPATPSTPTVTPNPNPTTPVAPTVETVSGKINLIPMTDTDITLSITNDKNEIKSYTAKKNEVVVKLGDSISSFTTLKVGQQATLTITNGKLTQIVTTIQTQRISGTLEKINSDSTITIKINNEIKTLKYDKNTQAYLNDKLTAIDTLPIGSQIDAYYQDDTLTKANVVNTKSEYSGEIIEYTSNTLTVKDSSGTTIKKELSSDVKIYRNDKRADMSSIAIGDTAIVYADKDKITNINIEAKSVKYLGSTIKSIQMNSDYNAIVITARDGKDHTLTINNSTIININDKKTNIYSLKIGYEVDVYAQGGLVEEIISKGEFKQTTVSGSVVDIDLVDKFIEIKQNDGKTIKVYYDNNTKIEKLSDSKTINARDIFKDDTITCIGIITGGNVTATRIIANI